MDCQDCNQPPDRDLHDFIIIYYQLEQSKILSDIKIKNNKDFETLEYTFQDTTGSLSEGATSKVLTIKRETLGKYKLFSSTRGVIIDQESYDFKGTFNDGIFIRENSTLTNAENGLCNIFDASLGKITLESCY